MLQALANLIPRLVSVLIIYSTGLLFILQYSERGFSQTS